MFNYRRACETLDSQAETGRDQRFACCMLSYSLRHDLTRMSVLASYTSTRFAALVCAIARRTCGKAIKRSEPVLEYDLISIWRSAGSRQRPANFRDWFYVRTAMCPVTSVGSMTDNGALCTRTQFAATCTCRLLFVCSGLNALLFLRL